MMRFFAHRAGRKRSPSLLLTGLLVWGLAGCSNGEVDTAKLQAAFQSADPATRAEVDEGVADIKAGGYPAALKVLQHAAFAGKLTKDQGVILKDSIKKVRDRIK